MSSCAGLKTCESPPINTQPEERIHLLDELRGLAVLGMLLINIGAFGVPSIAVSDPGLVGTFGALDRAIFNFMLLCGEGSFRAIFCVLFGIGALIQYERVAEKTNPENALVLHRRRMRWLMLFGLLDAYLFLWYGDILFLYGLVGLFLLSFRNLAASRLLLIALLLLSLLALQNLYFGEFLSAPKNQLLNPLDAENATSEAVRAQMISEANAEVEAIRAGYLSAWPTRALLAAYMQLLFLLRSLWEVLALMLIGMAVYKWGAHQARFSAARYLVFSITCLSIGLLVNLWEIEKSASTGLPALVQLLWTYDLGRIALAFSYAGFFMLLNKLDLAKGLASGAPSGDRAHGTHELPASITHLRIHFCWSWPFRSRTCQLRFHHGSTSLYGRVVLAKEYGRFSFCRRAGCGSTDTTLVRLNGYGAPSSTGSASPSCEAAELQAT